MTQFPQFQTLSPLDRADLIVNNALNGRLSALLRPTAQMTPEERETLAQSLLDEEPSNPFLKAAVGVLTDPLALMGILLMTRFKVPRPDKLFRVADDLSPIVAEQSSLLKALGLKKFATGNQIYDGTTIAPVLEQVQRGRYEVLERMGSKYQPALAEWAQRSGRHALSADPFDDRLVYAATAGLHQAHKEIVRTGFKTIEVAGRKVRMPVFEAVDVAPILNRDLVNRELAARGLTGVVAAQKEAFDEGWKMLTGDNAALIRIARGIADGSLGGNSGSVRMLADLMGDDILRLAKSGVPEKDLADLIRSAIPKQLEFYAPRNVRTMYRMGPKGIVKADSDFIESLGQEGRIPTMLRASRNLISRERPPLIDPDDLDGLEALAGNGPERAAFNAMRNQAIAAKAKIGTQNAKGEIVQHVSFLKLSAEEAFERYQNAAGRTWGLYGQPLPQHIRELMDRNQSAFVARDAADKSFRATLAGSKVPFEPLHRAKKPPGDWSLFDALKRDYTALADKYTKDALTEVHLPAATGTLPVKQGVFTATAINMQQWTKRLLDSDFGKQIPEPLRKQMASFSDRELRGMTADRKVANFFYSTTLGANFGAPLLNLTQTANLYRFVDPRHVTAAYGDTFKQLGGYLSERASRATASNLVGLRGKQERVRLLRKHVPFADDIGAIDDLDSSLEIALSAPSAVKRDTLLSKGQEALLKVFTNSERFNRLVAANAGVRAAKANGQNVAERIVGDKRLFADETTGSFVRRLIDETQFTPSFLNTPTQFIKPGSVFANPSIRQFLTFPVRQLTSLWFGGRLGATEAGQRGQNTAIDLLRTLGISSIMYEAGKGLFGIDLTEATPLGSGTAIHRDFGPFAPLPVPPVIGAPVALLSALGTGDYESLSFALPAFVPGGIGLSKAIGLVPGLGEAATDLNFSRQFVDYSRRAPDGRYPIMDGAGRVISYETPGSLALRGAGLARFDRTEQEVLETIRSVGDQTRAARRDYLLALNANNVSKASAIQQDFKRRYGFELSVSESDLRQSAEREQRTRVERALEGLPAEFRDRLAPSLPSGFQPGVPTPIR